MRASDSTPAVRVRFAPSPTGDLPLYEAAASLHGKVVTGGIAHSPDYAGPVIASVTNRPVFIPAEATEGTAVGAARLHARYTPTATPEKVRLSARYEFFDSSKAIAELGLPRTQAADARQQCPHARRERQSRRHR
jgi:predicted NodU family carbamoyl transferase